MTETSDGVISSLFHHTPYSPITEGHLRSQYQETNSYPTPTNKKTNHSKPLSLHTSQPSFRYKDN